MSALSLIPESTITRHTSGKYNQGGETGTNALTAKVGTENNASYTTTLQDMLALKQEIVLDFTSLKACLDPQREKSEEDEVCAAHAH